MTVNAWDDLQHRIVTCGRCPRLREHCTRTATEKRAAFRSQEYWGRPLANLGGPTARLLVVGLAPAAHGGNRTGRMFTGDRSADFFSGRCTTRASPARRSQCIATTGCG